jgi:drug/metabolite transporter (DMT)-like permease
MFKTAALVAAALMGGVSATTFWYANMDHTGAARGYAPELGTDYTYPVYWAVAAGATASDIQNAINAKGDGTDRPGEWLANIPRVR